MTHAHNIVPFMHGAPRRLNILAVEDDRLIASFMEEQIRMLGHSVLQAANGREALDLLKSRKGDVDIVLMDRMMPVMDGLTAVRLIKDDPELRRVPVVMVTGASSPQEIREGIEAGVFYYMTKPVDEDVLRSIILAASREADQARSLSEQMKKHNASFHLIHTCKFEFSTLQEAEDLSAFMANCFPDPERVISGLAELMVNAVEHGNLGIGYERKTQLVDNGTLRAEIERRQKLPEYMQKKVEAIVTRKQDGVYAVITDQGDGFEWQKFMQIDPARAGHNHGRGIAQARAVCFDQLTYNAKGTQAVAFVAAQSALEW